MNLLFAIDQKFVGLLLGCMHSIIQNGGEEHYTAYILHSDLTTEQKQTIRKDVDGRIFCHFIEVEPGLFEDFPQSKRYPMQIYYRLVAPLLLPRELDRILYLDVDTVVINPLQGLYNMDFSGNYYIACTHTKEFLARINQARLKIKQNVPYINTGVMLLNLVELRENLRVEDIQACAEEKMHTLLLPDQDILMALYGDKIQLADTMRYNLSDRAYGLYNASLQNEKIDLDWVRQNTSIIHYCGKNKPWKPGYVGPLGVFYRELNERSQ